MATNFENSIIHISYSFGVVDLFNFGHLKGLRLASENSDYRVFGLVTDSVAKNWMGNIVSSQDERKAVIESNRYVDETMLQDSMDPTDNLKILHSRYPDAVITLFHGTDISVFPAENYLKEIGGKVEIFEYSDKFRRIRINILIFCLLKQIHYLCFSQE